MDILVFLAGQWANLIRSPCSIYAAQNGAKPMPRITWSNGPGFHLDAAERAYRRMRFRNDPTGRRRSSSDRAALALLRSCLQRQGVQSAAHFGVVRLVDNLLLLDP